MVRKPSRGTKPKKGGSPTKPLRGGVGDQPAGVSPFADIPAAEDSLISEEMVRRAIDRPTTLEGIRKRMAVKKADSLQQIADATLTAAIQNRAASDAGSRLYGRAFQSLTNDAKQRLLDAISPDDVGVPLEELAETSPRRIVLEQFGGDFIEADAVEIVQPATTSNRQMSVRERAKEAARKALADANLEPIEVVNLDRTLPTESPSQTYVSGMSDNNVIVVDKPDGWTDAEIARGYRVGTFAPEVAPARATGGGSQGPNFAASRIDLEETRIKGLQRSTDTQYYLAIEDAKANRDLAEAKRLSVEKKAAEDRFKEILSDPEQVRALARASAEEELTASLARLQEAVSQESDPAKKADLQRRYVAAEQRVAADLASFNRPASTPTTSDTAAPSPTAQRTVVLVLADRAGEFTGTRPRASEFAVENPDFGQTSIHYRPKPGTRPDMQVVDRLTPSAFEELSPEAQRAAARGAELQDAVEEFERWNPDFLETKEGQRISVEMGQLLTAFPEIDAYIDNPMLMSRQMPPLGNAVTAESGRAALPPNMRLTEAMGSAERQKYKIATQTERRTGGYADIPADAPNRMAWIMLKDAEEATKRNMTLDSYLRSKKSKNIEGGGQPKKRQFADRVEVYLPETAEIAMRHRRKGGVQADTDYEGGDAPRTTAAPAEIDSARMAELDAQYANAAARVEAAKNTGPSAPVEDLTQDPDYYKFLREDVDRVPLRGSATGSPKQVKYDRDFALREGKSVIEKLREKVFRLANEAVDADRVGVSERGLGIGETGGAGSSAVGENLGDDMRSAAMQEALGMDDPVRTRSGKGRGGRDNRGKTILPLDSLIPPWRGYMQFEEGGQIVTRRPNAMEVAGFILDQLDLPDAGMASRLESHVQFAMDALEAEKPRTARAKRAAGTVFQRPKTAAAAMEEAVASRRGIGDQRPLYNEESALAANEAAARARAEFGEAFQNDESAFVRQDEVKTIEGQQVAPAGQSEWTVDPTSVPEIPADAGTAPAATTADAVAAFSKMRKGASGGGSSTNIGNLIALAAAGLGAQSAMAGEPEGSLPPVEYLAMARAPGAAQRTANAAKKAAEKAAAEAAAKAGQAAPAPAPSPAPAPAPQAGGAATPPNLPSRRGKQSKPKPQVPAPGTAAGAAPAPAPAPAAAGGAAQPPAGPPGSTAAAAPSPTDPPKPPFFNPNDPLVQLGKIIGSKFGNPLRSPTLMYLAASAPELDKDNWMQKYNPIQGFVPALARGYMDMFGTESQPADAIPTADSEAAMDALFRQGGVFEETPEERRAAPLPAPQMNQGSSNNIDALRRMLNNQRRMV